MLRGRCSCDAVADEVVVRVPYGTLVDEPTLEIVDDLPRYDEYPW